MKLDLSDKTPGELRRIAAALGIANADRMTAAEAHAAILAQEGLDMQSRFIVYEGEDGLWYWRHVADNGQQLSRSSEGYDSKWNAERARDKAVELTAEEWARENRASRASGSSE